MRNKNHWLLAVASVSAVLLAGCSGAGTKDASTAPTTAPDSGISTAGTGTGNVGGSELNTVDLSQHSIYFDLDKSELKPESVPVVDAWSTYLSGHPAAKVRLEGNCDERGTREYNVGLGERRANAVAQALEAKGVSPSQVSVISYGEERPVCTQHDESCWAQNRRADVVQQ